MNAFDAARRLANANHRAANMGKEGYTIENLGLDNLYVIKPGQQDAFPFCDGYYMVNVLAPKCNCPDFAAHDDTCKHVLFAQNELAEEIAQHRQMKQAEADYAACELESTGIDYRI